MPFPHDERSCSRSLLWERMQHTCRKVGWMCSSVTFLKAHVNTCTELRLFKIPQLFLLYILVSKGFSCSLCFDVKTTAIFVIIASLHWEMFFP